LRGSSKQFFCEKTCKKFADLHPRHGNLLQKNIFTGPLLTTQNRWKKIALFQHASSSTKISMQKIL
jgi:hypothetical protein